MKKKIDDILILTMGAFIVAVGIYFFKIPNKFSTGGVSGISVVLSAFSKKISATHFIFIINMILLLLGYIIVGKSFSVKTIYCSVFMSVVLNIFQHFYPLSKPITNQPFLELFFAIVLPAVGSAMLFNVGASTGGTDIIAMVIKKYTSINISKALFISDFLIVMSTFFVFGIETWLFSVIGFVCKVFLVNTVLKNINISKYCTIVTSPQYVEQIQLFITQTMKKSATTSSTFQGAYDGKKRCVILTALNPQQTNELKKYITSIDSNSFIIINSTSDICGKGFKATV